MEKWVYVNGDYLPAREAKVSVYDRSYLLGEGLFETMRSYDGKILFLDDHLQRMEWASTFLDLPFPSDVDFSEVCRLLYEKNGFAEGRFKLVLSRVEYATDDVEPQLTVFCEDLNEVSIPKFFKLKTLTTYKNDAPPLACIKSTSYLTKVMARYEAKQFGVDDCLLLNHAGHVTEASSANVFWVDKKGLLWTVLGEQGMIPGVTKKKLCELLARKKIKLKEGVITPQELSHAREVFVTNSVIGVKPVVEIDKRQISGGEVGDITAMIHDLWVSYIEELL